MGRKARRVGADVLAEVGRGREQDHLDAARECRLDHPAPGCLAALQADHPVVERIVDQQYVRSVGQHLGLEAGGALLRLLAADGRRDHVHDGVGILVLDQGERPVGIGLQRVDEGCTGVAGRHAVAVEDDVDGPVVRPAFLQLGAQLGEVGLRIRDRTGPEAGGQEQQYHQGEDESSCHDCKYSKSAERDGV